MKIKTILAGLAGLALAACTENTDLLEKVPVMGKNSINIEVTDEFAAAATRADYSGFPSTAFEIGDAIGLYAFDGSSYVTSNMRFVKQSDGSWTPDEEVPYVEDYTYYAYFPYRATTYTPATTGTVDDIDTKFASFISDASNYFWLANQSTKANYTASNLMIAKGTVTGTNDNEVTVKFTMHHERGLAVFDGAITSLTFTGNTPYQVNGIKHFLMKPNTATSFTDNTGTYSLTADAGEYITHTTNRILGDVEATDWNKSSAVTDLSMVDNAGNPTITMNTANCYLVHSAGNYKLPLVYGNAIKYGEDNVIAYYPGEDESITNGLNRFCHHNWSSINGPWITKSTSGTGVNKGMGITVDGAELLWQDAQGLITSVSISGDYLCFTVGTYTSGNAVIAAKSGSTIVWSWHIWATDNDLSNTVEINTGSHSYAVAPVNLGWVAYDKNYPKRGYAPYYQWGRKDPFIPASSYSGNVNHTVYDINNNTVTGITYSASETTWRQVIQNPTTFYYNEATYGPLKWSYYNLWDAQNSSTGNVATATKKTVYDPCPPGFCVPTSNLYYYMADGDQRAISSYDYLSKAAKWQTGIFGIELSWPSSGFRDPGNGNLSEVGSTGSYWSSTPNNSTTSCRIVFNTSYWQWLKPKRANGFPIRPVKEEN